MHAKGSAEKDVSPTARSVTMHAKWLSSCLVRNASWNFRMFLWSRAIRMSHSRWKCDSVTPWALASSGCSIQEGVWMTLMATFCPETLWMASNTCRKRLFGKLQIVIENFTAFTSCTRCKANSLEKPISRGSGQDFWRIMLSPRLQHVYLAEGATSNGSDERVVPEGRINTCLASHDGDSSACLRMLVRTSAILCLVLENTSLCIIAGRGYILEPL